MIKTTAQLMHDLAEPELADDLMEYQANAAMEEYLTTGWLPGGFDTSHVDDRAAENQPELLDTLITAPTDADLLAIAKRLRDERIAVINDIIMDNMEELV